MAVNFIDFYNGADNKNRIIMTHTGDSSRLQLKMYNDAGKTAIDAFTLPNEMKRELFMIKP